MTKLLMDAASSPGLSRSNDAGKPGCTGNAESPAASLFSISTPDVSTAGASTCGWPGAAGTREAEPDDIEPVRGTHSEPLDSHHVAFLPREEGCMESPGSEPGRHQAGHTSVPVDPPGGRGAPAGAGDCEALGGWHSGADSRDGAGAQAAWERGRAGSRLQELEESYGAFADPSSRHISPCHSPRNYARVELYIEHVGLSEERKQLRRRLSFEGEALGIEDQQQGAAGLSLPRHPITDWHADEHALAAMPGPCETLAGNAPSDLRAEGYTTRVPMCISISVEEREDESAMGCDAQSAPGEQTRHSVLIRGPLGSLFVGTEGSKHKLRQEQKALSALQLDAAASADGQPRADPPCIPALASHESAHSWTAGADEASESDDEFVFEPYVESDAEKGSNDFMGIHIILPPPPRSPEPTPEDLRGMAPLFDPQRIASFKRKKGMFICLLLLGSALYAISFIVGILVASGYTGNASSGLDMLSQAMLASSNTWVAMANLVLYLSMDLIGLTGALLEYSPVLSLYIAVEIVITAVSALEALRPLLIYRLVVIFCAYLLRYECLELMEAERHLRNRVMGTPLPPPNTNTILARIRFFPGTFSDMWDHTMFLYQHPFTVIRGWTFHRFRRRSAPLSS